jgi:hypothetical protein
MVGACVSFTVTVKLQVEVFPDPSVAVTTTVLTPAGNTDPEAGAAELLAPQLSVSDGRVKLTTALHKFGSVDTEIFAGQLATGATASTIVTLKLQLFVPQLSVTVRVTDTVCPPVYSVPGAGDCVTTGVPQALLTTARLVKLFSVVWQDAFKFWVCVAGQVMEIPSTAFTVKVWVQVWSGSQSLCTR